MAPFLYFYIYLQLHYFADSTFLTFFMMYFPYDTNRPIDIYYCGCYMS